MTPAISLGGNVGSPKCSRSSAIRIRWALMNSTARVRWKASGQVDSLGERPVPLLDDDLLGAEAVGHLVRGEVPAEQRRRCDDGDLGP